MINAGRSFVIRSDLRGDAGKAIPAGECSAGAGRAAALIHQERSRPNSGRCGSVVPTPAHRAARRDGDSSCEKQLSKTGHTVRGSSNIPDSTQLRSLRLNGHLRSAARSCPLLKLAMFSLLPRI